LPLHEIAAPRQVGARNDRVGQVPRNDRETSVPPFLQIAIYDSLITLT